MFALETSVMMSIELSVHQNLRLITECANKLRKDKEVWSWTNFRLLQLDGFKKPQLIPWPLTSDSQEVNQFHDNTNHRQIKTKITQPHSPT